MDWKVPFVIYRITPEGKLEEVFFAKDFKEATYWLTYIAQPGDVLCKTPLHKKHSHASQKAEYWSHKGDARDPVVSEQEWRQRVSSRLQGGEFPEQQSKEQA